MPSEFWFLIALGGFIFVLFIFLAIWDVAK